MKVMTKAELNEECIKHGVCKECPYREFTSYGEWHCSVRNEDLEEE